MADTVLLFGTNTYTRHLIDWTRQDCEFWAWNEVGSLKDDRPGYWAQRVDLLIQIHAAPIWRNHKNLNHGRHQKIEGGANSNSHYDWLQRPHEFPIYMQEHYDDVPSSVKYPKEEIVKEIFPNIWRDVDGDIDQVENFTSSTAYAIALAIYQGKKKIELAGIELTSDTEYVRQRPGVYFWLGIAVGRGIDVVLHSPLLMNEKPYGYTGEVMIQRQEFEMSCRKLDDLVEQSKMNTFTAKGQSQAMLDAVIRVTDHGQIVNSFLSDMSKLSDPAKAQERVSQFVAEFQQNQSNAQRIAREFIKTLENSQDQVFNYGVLAGRYQENARYVQECDELINAAGGEKALEVLMQRTNEIKELVNEKV